MRATLSDPRKNGGGWVCVLFTQKYGVFKKCAKIGLILPYLNPKQVKILPTGRKRLKTPENRQKQHNIVLLLSLCVYMCVYMCVCMRMYAYAVSCAKT